MRSVQRMFLTASSLATVLLTSACADPMESTAPVALPPSLSAVAATAPFDTVRVAVGDTVQIPTTVAKPTWTPRNKAVLKLVTYDGRLKALAPGKTWVVVWTSPYRIQDYRDSTLVIVGDRDASDAQPTPEPEETPQPGQTPQPEPEPTSPGTTDPVSGAYYVAPNGSDSNPGTKSQPWRSIASALSRLQPGQTLYLRGGTYTEDVKNPSIKPGRPDARITVAAYPGERPVIVGFFWLTRPSYWTLDGVNVTWRSGGSSKDHMVKLTNGVGWVLQNSELWGARSFANLLVAGTTRGEPSDWAVRNNCIHDTHPSNAGNKDHNMYVNTANSPGSGVIERNVVFNAPNGQNIKLGFGRSDPQVGDGTSNVTVRYNTMHNALKNMAVADYSANNKFERNLVSKSADGYAMRAYRLKGQGNTLRDNLFHGMTRLQYADAGHLSVTDAGGNRMPVDPKFNGLTCSTFKPGNAEAAAYGHLAR